MLNLVNPDNTRMNCCDSWRHISDSVELERCTTGVKQTSLGRFIARFKTANLIHHQRDDERMVWFTPHTFSTSSTVLAATSACFCCKAACFVPIWLSPTWKIKARPWRARTRKWVVGELTRGAEEKEASSATVGLLWWCCRCRRWAV